MAFRPDVYVLWQFSPRLIVVEAPSTEITLQDLVDTLRTLEAELPALDDDSLLSASGKEELGGGLLVGITVELFNAKLGFEGRTTPISTGAATANNTAGTLLTDAGADFIADGVTSGDTVLNHTDGSSAAVIEVIDGQNLLMIPLDGGVLDTWTIGDAYYVYGVDTCLITGGNLVAVDINDDPMSATFITPHVSISVEKATSAALIDNGVPVTAGDLAVTEANIVSAVNVSEVNVTAEIDSAEAALLAAGTSNTAAINAATSSVVNAARDTVLADAVANKDEVIAKVESSEMDVIAAVIADQAAATATIVAAINDIDAADMPSIQAAITASETNVVTEINDSETAIVAEIESSRSSLLATILNALSSFFRAKK